MSKEVILQILRLLDRESESVQDFLKTDEDCVQSLIKLDGSCSYALVDVARDLLECADDEQDEYKFQAILRALISRCQPEAFELTSKAFLSRKAADKETYLNYLGELGDSRTVTDLIKFLEQCEAVDALPQNDESLVSLVKETIERLDRKDIAISPES